MNAKAVLRAEIRNVRDALPAEVRAKLSARIAQRVLELDAWQAAQGMLLYLSVGSEFNSDPLVMAAIAQGKRICLPRIDASRKALEIHWVDDLRHETKPGAFGVREPLATCPRATAGAINFVLTPGLAFSPRGERLGYGGGYYDKLLGEFAHAATVAATFALQMRDYVPTEPTDRRVNWVVTEEAVYAASLSAR